MMSGNYARVLFDPANEEIILGLIDDNEKDDALVSILDKFRFMQSIYHAIKPDLNHVAMYKTITVAMGELIKTHFSFARWPNYLHKLIKHIQDILQDPNNPGSIGAFSREGNEAGNKIFRLFSKKFSTTETVTAINDWRMFSDYISSIVRLFIQIGRGSMQEKQMCSLW